MISVEVRSSGKSRNVYARGFWHEPILPWWHACTALSRAESDVRSTEPRDGVAIIIRREP